MEAYRGSHRALFTRFSILMFVYMLFLAFELFIGSNNGAVRYWLSLLPLSAIGFGVYADHTRNRWLLLICIVVTVLFTVVGFQQISLSHAEYLRIYGADEEILRGLSP